MSWPLVKLKDVAPARAVSHDFMDSDHVWHLNLDQVEPETGRILQKVFAPSSEAGVSTHGFDERHVLYSKLRPYLNKVVLPDKKGLATTELVPLLPDQKRLDRKYLAYYLRSKGFVEWVSAQVAGAKMPRVSMQVFWQHEIPLPPLPEQKRIAAILDKADAICRKRQQAIRLADDFLRAVFLDMFGDPVTNPKGWEVRLSGELFSVPPRIGTTTPADGQGYLVVRVGEIGKLDINFSKCGRAHLKNSELERFILRPGDTVLARAIGSKNQLGKASFFSGYSEDVYIDSHVMRLRPNVKMCNPEWFYRFISSDGGKSLLQKAGGETAVQFNINAKQAASLLIPLPPIELQNEFIVFCQKLSRSKAHLSKQAGDFEMLFSSLSQKAFSGQL